MGVATVEGDGFGKWKELTAKSGVQKDDKGVFLVPLDGSFGKSYAQSREDTFTRNASVARPCGFTENVNPHIQATC